MQLKFAVPDDAAFLLVPRVEGQALAHATPVFTGKAKDFIKARTGIKNGGYLLQITHDDFIPIQAPVTLTGGRLTFPPKD